MIPDQKCTFTTGCSKPAIYEMKCPDPKDKTLTKFYVCADCDERLSAVITQATAKITQEIKAPG